MTTALTLPTSVKPPPNKTELIEAMVERARQKVEAENKANTEARDEINAKIKAAALKFIKSQLKTIKPETLRVSRHDWRQSAPTVEIEFERFTMPADMEALHADLAKFPRLGFDEKAARQNIRNHLNGSRSERVTAILSDAKTVAAIDAQLEAIG